MEASPKSSISSSSPRISNKVDDEEFNDEYDDDIEDPESLNRTLSEIIEGKRSSTSLIAMLNRDNSDCDSIKSSSSEASSNGQKVSKSNSFKGSKTSETERLTSVEETSNATEIKVGAGNQSKTNAINQSSCENKIGTQSVTCMQSCIQSNDKNCAITEVNSHREVNGDVSPEMDANENIHVKGVKHKPTNDTSSTEVPV